MITKPMLAAKEKDIPKLLKAIRYPVLATPKLDGIRCLTVGRRALTRALKDQPNQYVRDKISALPDGLDGELIVLGKTFNEIQSLIMTRSGTPDFHFFVFDYVKDDLLKPYDQRIEDLKALSPELPMYCQLVLPIMIHNDEDLMAYEAKCLTQGFEGVMIRTVDSPYKCNRSTLKEGYLIAIKRFVDSEAIIIGFEEKLHNNNPAQTNELGRTKRSSHQENLVPAGTTGVILAKDITDGTEIRIGTGIGLNDELKLDMWTNKDKYIGKIITYSYQEHGMKDKPRIPSFKGFRSAEDMS